MTNLLNLLNKAIGIVKRCIKQSKARIKEQRESKHSGAIIARELLSTDGNSVRDEYGNYCLQIALNECQTECGLIQEFESSMQPRLKSFTEKVKVKRIKLLGQEKKRLIGFIHLLPQMKSNMSAGSADGIDNMSTMNGINSMDGMNSFHGMPIDTQRKMQPQMLLNVACKQIMYYQCINSR